jgi:hypothetical protein
MQISEAFIHRIANQLLRLNGHELRVKPRSEHLAVERLVPTIVVVLVGIFQFDGCGVGLDLSNVEEHFVDFLVSVRVRTA